MRGNMPYFFDLLFGIWGNPPPLGKFSISSVPETSEITVRNMNFPYHPNLRSETFYFAVIRTQDSAGLGSRLWRLGPLSFGGVSFLVPAPASPWLRGPDCDLRLG